MVFWTKIINAISPMALILRQFIGDNARYHHPQGYFHKSTSVALIKYHPAHLCLCCADCSNQCYCFPAICIQTTQTVRTFTSWGQKRRISSAATPRLCASILRGSATVQTTAGTTRTRPTARVNPLLRNASLIISIILFSESIGMRFRGGSRR